MKHVKNKPKCESKIWQRCGASAFYSISTFLWGKRGNPEFGLGEQVVLQLTTKLQNCNVKTFCELLYFTYIAYEVDHKIRFYSCIAFNMD